MPTTASSTLPLEVLYATTIGLLAFQLWVLTQLREPTARFVVTAIWLRYVMSAFHHVTYEPIAGGLSLNALVSCAVVALGIWFAGPRNWRLRALGPVYLILAVLLLSGLVNMAFAGLFSAAMKWAYFLVVLLCAYQATRRMGVARFAGVVLLAFVPPIVFLAESVVLGVSKVAGVDGARGYIGGYSHEGAFSVVLATGLWAAAFATRLPGWLRHAVALVFVVGLYLALYRTTLIAVAPLAGAYVIFSAAMHFRRPDRIAVSAIAAALGLVALGVVAYVLREQFMDFAALASGADVFRAPEAFSPAERDLFSSRLYLWSQYLAAYGDGGPLVWLIGYGPEAWDGQFSKYAHNTFVSTLYETGALGAAALLTLWCAMGWQALRARDASLRILLFSGHIMFMLVNMATMGHWLIEGMILYALVCAFTLAHAPAAAPARPLARAYRPPAGARGDAA